MSEHTASQALQCLVDDDDSTGTTSSSGPWGENSDDTIRAISSSARTKATSKTSRAYNSGYNLKRELGNKVTLLVKGCEETRPILQDEIFAASFNSIMQQNYSFFDDLICGMQQGQCGVPVSHGSIVIDLFVRQLIDLPIRRIFRGKLKTTLPRGFIR